MNTSVFHIGFPFKVKSTLRDIVALVADDSIKIRYGTCRKVDSVSTTVF